ncbi:hypothetical protein D3C78_952280 [compost metagenome]
MVTTRQFRAAQVQLAGHAGRHRVELGVEDVQAARTDGGTDWRVGRATFGIGSSVPQQRRDHGFGRAVAVGQLARTQGALDQLEVALRHRIATEAVGVYRRRVVAALGILGQLLQIGRWEAGDGDAVTMQGLPGFFRGPQAVVTQHQLPAGQQRRQPALLGTVEGKGHEQQLTSAAVHRITLGDGLAVQGNRPVGHRHAFGHAGGTGGVDQVGKVVRIHRLLHHRDRPRALQIEVLEVDPLCPAERRQLLAQMTLAEQDGHAGIVHDPLQALTRVADVQRHECGTGLEHGVQGHHRVQRTLEGDTDEGFRTGALCQQMLCQAVGLGFQFGVTQLLIAAHQGNRLWLLACVFGNAQRQQLLRGRQFGSLVDFPANQLQRAHR